MGLMHDRRVFYIDAMQFAPPCLRVRAGDEIVWQNTDLFPRQIKAKGAFDAGLIQPQGVWHYAAGHTGYFPYSGTLHPGMQGMLIVTAK